MSSSVLQIENYSKKAIFVKLLDIEYRSVWNKKLASFDPEWNKSDTEPGWIISKRHEDDLFQLLKESRRSRKPKNEEHKYSRIKKHESTDHSGKSESSGKNEAWSEKNKSGHHSRSSRSSRSSEDSGSEHSEDSDDSSEDELIQQTLTRKLKYESSQKVIEEENIENSDLEDVISMCRRIRHLLQANRQLSERIRELEKRLKDQ